jgi:hypothetical protein
MRSLVSVGAFFVSFALFLLGFAMASTAILFCFFSDFWIQNKAFSLVFGGAIDDFSGIFRSFVTLWRSMLGIKKKKKDEHCIFKYSSFSWFVVQTGDIDAQELFEADPVFGYLLYISFTFIMVRNENKSFLLLPNMK